ncbi:MAG: ABC transporter ATP-binding protein [Bacteroidota bacterium]|nr:ABC transporter ATP-binding protein [Bacteroidota bacterium]
MKTTELVKPILETCNLTIGYDHRKEGRLELLSNINLKMIPGEMVCLIGPNGCGKSTLMRTMAGIQPALSGKTLVEGRTIKERNFKDIARLISMVLTDRLTVGNLSVFHIVSLGRYPYNNWFGGLSHEDKSKIFEALDQVHMRHMMNRQISELSDGEKQRVMIAKALAQDTPLVLLDEPTAHLDLPNRVETMKLLRMLTKETGKAILLTTHELDLALQAADTIWLMNNKSHLETGCPEDLVLNGKFEQAFKTNSFEFDLYTGSFKLNHHKVASICFQDGSIEGFWTKRALEREGFELTDDESLPVKLNVDGENRIWKLKWNGGEQSFYDVATIIKKLREIFSC